MSASSNQKMIGRFLWKELRQGVPIAIFFGLLALALTAIGWMFVEQLSTELEGFVGGTWFCLLGVLLGSILFASEKESGTFRNLQCLPIRWWDIFAGKLMGGLLVAVAAPIVLLLGILAISSFGLANRSFIDYQSVLRVLLPGTLMYFAIALVVSTQVNSTLHAALAGIAIGSLVDAIFIWLTSTASTDFFSIETYAVVGVFRMVAAIVFLLAAIPASRKWWFGTATEQRRQERANLASSKVSERVVPRATQRRAVVHLLWQAMHENFRSVAWIAALIVLPSLVLKLLPLNNNPDNSFLTAIFIGLSMWAACFATGISCFANDQKRNAFRFFVQQKEHPRLLWFARHLFWLTVLFVIYGALTLIGQAQWNSPSPPWSMSTLFHLNFLQHNYDFDHSLELASALGSRTNTYLILGGLLVYGLAQLCSQQFRSSLFGGMIALFAIAPVTIWVVICMMSGTPWFVSLLPLVLATFFLSWYWAPQWLIEKSPAKGWGLSGFVMLLTTAACIVSVNVHQANIIPVAVRTWQWESTDQPDIWTTARSNFAAVEFKEQPVSESEPSWTDKPNYGISFDETDEKKILEFVATNAAAYSNLHQAIDYLRDNWSEFEGTKPTGKRGPNDLPAPFEPNNALGYYGPLKLEIEAALIAKEPTKSWAAIHRMLFLKKADAHLTGYYWRYFRKADLGAINKWLALPNLEAQHIQQAMKDVERLEFDLFAAHRRSIANYFEPYPDSQLVPISKRTKDRLLNFMKPIDSTVAIAKLLIPGDKIRDQRWNYHLEIAKLQQIDNIQQKQNDGELVSYFRRYQHPSDYLPRTGDFLNWYSHSLSPRDDARYFDTFQDSMFDFWQRIQEQRRLIGLKTKMAIVCFQIEEGRLPETLQELVDVDLLSEIPLDLVTQLPLAWIPTGINRPIARSYNSLYVQEAPANVGLLFCSPATNLREIETRVLKPEQFLSIQDLDPDNLDGEPFEGMIQTSHGIDSPEQSMHLFWIAPRN